jgi:hypothetical protein
MRHTRSKRLNDAFPAILCSLMNDLKVSFDAALTLVSGLTVQLPVFASDEEATAGSAK